MRSLGGFIVGLVLVSITSLPAFSTPITWELVNVTGIDGATFTGSFVYDADTNTYSSINITATAGPVPASDYAPSTTFLYQDPCCSTSALAFLSIDSNAADLTGANALDLEFAAALTDAGGAVALSSSSSAGFCLDSVCSSYFPYGEYYPVTGSVKAVATVPSFLVRYAANLNIAESYIDIQNTGANGNNAQGPGFGTLTGNICVNVYAFDPNEELIACCSCLVTPDQTVNLGVNANLVSKTLTGVVPTSVTVKLAATAPAGTSATSGGNCTNSAAGSAGTLTVINGMAAWGTTLHATPTVGSYGTTETAFTLATPSPSELASIAGRCSNIIGNASGFGICSSCRSGALGGSKL